MHSPSGSGDAAGLCSPLPVAPFLPALSHCEAQHLTQLSSGSPNTAPNPEQTCHHTAGVPFNVTQVHAPFSTCQTPVDCQRPPGPVSSLACLPSGQRVSVTVRSAMLLEGISPLDPSLPLAPSPAAMVPHHPTSLVTLEGTDPRVWAPPS